MIGYWAIDNNYTLSFEPIHKELGTEVNDIVKSITTLTLPEELKYSGEVVYNNRTQMYEIRYMEDGFSQDYQAIDIILHMFKLNYLRCNILQGDPK